MLPSCHECHELARRLDVLLRVPLRSVELGLSLAYLRATLADHRERGCGDGHLPEVLRPTVARFLRAGRLDALDASVLRRLCARLAVHRRDELAPSDETRHEQPSSCP